MHLQDDEPDVPAQINIVPMIDVVFAVLTFFVMSTLFLTRSEGLPVNLPKASTAQQQQSTQVTITVDAQGQILLNQEPIQVDVLETQIRQLVTQDAETLIVLNADEAVNYGQVVAVMDRLRKIDGIRLAIATQQPESQQP